jgi:hypothetical protein
MLSMVADSFGRTIHEPAVATGEDAGGRRLEGIARFDDHER